MQSSTDVANIKSIAEKLQGHKQLNRLKKLINFTCTNNWESDANILNKLDLKKLLEELYQKNSSLEDLSESLYQSVDRLNRQTVYSDLANLIIAKIGVLYEDSQNSTEVIMVKPSVRDKISQSVFKQITVNLNKDSQLPRIKKLIFYLVKDKWENDVTVIDSYDFLELTIELREMYDNLGDLTKAFNDIVATLNRQHVYLAVSQTIINNFKLLYKEESDTNLFSKSTNIIDKQEIAELNLSQQEKLKSNHNVAKNGSQTAIQELESDTVIQRASVAESKENQKEENQKEENQEEENQKEQKNSKNDNYTLFDWRLDIMQYTNPLRVKILLFSVNYHVFEKNEKDWSKLKSCTLEGLLSKTLNRYQSFNEIKTKMYEIAKILPESELNQQTATVIIKSLSSFYPNQAEG